MGVGSRCVGFAPNFGGGATEKNKFSKRTTFKIIGVKWNRSQGCGLDAVLKYALSSIRHTTR